MKWEIRTAKNYGYDFGQALVRFGTEDAAQDYIKILFNCGYRSNKHGRLRSGSAENSVGVAERGTYTVYAPKTVKLSCGTKGASIYYKLDSGKYKKYVSPITLEKNCTLSFYAEKNGAKSSVVMKKYKLVSPVDISVPTGFYPVNVTFNTIADDITLYYTTDGSKPTKSSAKVKDGKLAIKKSCTLRVLAVKSGWTSKYYRMSVTAEKDELKPSLVGGYTNKFLYNTLNDTEKEFYRRLYDGVINYDEKIDLEDIDITKDEAAMPAIFVRCENPELFRCYDISVFTSNNKPIYAVPKYTVTDRTLEQKRSAQLREIGDDYLAEVKKLPTDFERALYIYDRVTNEVTYSPSFLEGNKPYSEVSRTDNALIDRDAVCLGYAQAITYLCQYAGIPCFTELSANHAWNRINIGGSWYAMDATWDDNAENVNSHIFFLNTNDEFMANHSEVIDKNTLVHEAKSDSSEYTYLSGITVTPYTKKSALDSDGMKKARESLRSSSERLLFIYTDKVYEDNMGLVMLKSLNSHGICSKTISGLAEKTYTSISLTAYGSGDDLMKNGFATAAKNGCKQLTIWYSNGLKSSVGSAIENNFAALMKKNGANVTVKSMKFFDDHVLITLN